MYENFTSSLPSPEQSLGHGAPTQGASVTGGKSHALDDIQEEAIELLSEAFIFGDRNSVGPTGHLSTNTLEEYALGLLVEAERDGVEEHLLACPACTEKLERVDGVIALFKTVLIPVTAETSLPLV